MKIVRSCRGIVHWCDENRLFISRGYDIYESNDNGVTVSKVCTLPVSLKTKLKGISRVFSRFFRGGVRFLDFINNKLYILADKQLYIYDTARKFFEVCSDRVIGSNPLNLCITDNEVYYGSYLGNPNRDPVSIYKLNGSSWEIVYTFKNIRHIHGVFRDPYTGYFWVTTGDLDKEAAIWISKDNFKSVDVVISGSQQSRAISLIFTEEKVYYGSDTPSELNYLYSLDKKSANIRKICKVNGSVFFGCKANKNILFSTAVEPSSINTEHRASLWAVQVNDDSSWRELCSFKKDMLPMKLFQYGQIYLPQGLSPKNTLWCTPLGTENDNKSLLIKIEE